MTHEPSSPDTHAEVRIVAATPEAARRVAEVLRRCFASTEQRSYPAGGEGGTRLHLTLDTARTADPHSPGSRPAPRHSNRWTMPVRSDGQAQGTRHSDDFPACTARCTPDRLRRSP